MGENLHPGSWTENFPECEGWYLYRRKKFLKTGYYEPTMRYVIIGDDGLPYVKYHEKSWWASWGESDLWCGPIIIPDLPPEYN